MAKREKRGKLNLIQTAAKNVYGGGDMRTMKPSPIRRWRLMATAFMLS